jgi:TetR/AcrR family transcriptional regulator, tetracycline repressor protein
MAKPASANSERGRGRLQREGIVHTALTLMNEIGLDALSLRRLAEALEVQAPALYWHFKNKQELLNEMAEAMLASGQPVTTPAEVEWSEWLTSMAYSLRQVLLKYRDGAQLLASAEVAKGSLMMLDMTLGILVQAGFDYQQALIGTFTITNFVLGFTFEEQSSTRIDNEGEYLQKLIASHDLPNLAAAFQAVTIPFDSNAEFEASIALIVDSLKTRLAKPEQ